MKKILFCLGFVLLAGSMQAQFGVSAAYSLASVNYTDYGGKQNMNGFGAQLSYSFHIKNEWHLFSGLNYSQFSRTHLQQLGLGSQHRTYTHGFLEMPIMPAFVMEVLDELKISVSAGPTLSYALFGTKTTSLDGSNSNPTVNIYEDSDISPFNLLGGFNIGAQYGRLMLRMGYNWGILNQYNGLATDKVCRHSGLTISFGYVFEK